MRPYFIAVVENAAANWSFAACAQQRGDAGSRGPRQRVHLGLVASLPASDGNVTGIIFFEELAEERRELLRELTPSAARVGGY